MQAFADLLDRLEMEPRTEPRLRHLEMYFRRAPDPDRGYAAAILSGRLHWPRIAAKELTPLIEARADAALLRLAAAPTKDALEAMALAWPEFSSPAPQPSLSDCVEAFAIWTPDGPLAKLPRLLDGLDDRGRWALLKLYAGGRDLKLSARAVIAALAGLGGVAPAEVAEVWRPLEPPFSKLFAWLEGKAERPRRRDPLWFRDPAPTEPADLANLRRHAPETFAAEWKRPGVRAQWAGTGGRDAEIRVTDRDGRELAAALPELTEGLRVPAVLDGLLTAGPDAGALQSRLRRRRATAAVAEKQPVAFHAFDLLMLDGEDLRPLAYRERRMRLEDLIGPLNTPAFDLAPSDRFVRWDEVEDWLETPPEAAEGLILKPLDAAYGAAPWHLVAAAPKALRAVLMYAEPILRSRGLEATVGVWRTEKGRRALVPVGKVEAEEGTLAAEAVALFVKENTVNRFGPVREVAQSAEVGLVLEIAYACVDRAARRKAGIVLRAPRIFGIVEGARPAEAGDLEELLSRAPP